jgi:hypothetical protein
MPHTWRFFRSGGVDQVRLETADDLRNLSTLDPKLWVALACPVVGLDIDERTMALVDGNNDGRVRLPDLLAAVAFVCERLKDPSEILREPAPLSLGSIADTATGKVLATAARSVLAARGKANSPEIGVDDATDAQAILQEMPFDGDGVITVAAATDDATKSVITDVIATTGADKDRNGADGVSLERIDAFFAACARRLAHAEVVGAAAPFGPDATEAAYAAFTAVEKKVDDYFARTRLAAFEPRAAVAVNRADADYTALGEKSFSPSVAEADAFPLAHVVPDGRLPLRTGVNPAWADRIDALRAKAIVPFLGTDVAEIDLGQWERLRAALAPYAAWKADPIEGELAALPLARVREIVAAGMQAKLQAFVATDLEKKPEADAIADVERLVRYRRDLGRLLRNFVNFADFYGREKKAIFQAGTIYVDQRSCDLVLRVFDPARHAIMAQLSGAYLAYFDCVRKSDGLKLSVCAAVTNGDSDNLMVGRNGLFYDIQGRDYDATITKIVDNDISIRQAFWSPYKKAVRALEDFVAKRAASASAASDAKLTGAATTVAGATPPAPPPPFVPAKIDVGTVAALGVAVGGITAALGAILNAILGLKWWMPVGFAAIILLISGPSMIVAALKLRQRNIGPILDADGWALNAKARINIPFGRSLTQIRKLPPGSERDPHDPFAEEERTWPWILAVLIVIVGVFAYLTYKDIIHPRTWIQSMSVPTTQAPAASAPAPVAPAAVPTPAPPP